MRAGLTRVVHPEGVDVDLAPHESGSLAVGGLVEIVADLPPVGPLRVTARVASLESDRDSRGHSILSTSLHFESLSDIQRGALTRRLRHVRPLVVTFGLGRSIKDVLADDCSLVEPENADDTVRLVTDDDVAVLVIGPQVAAADAQRILARCHAQSAAARTANIVVGVGAGADLFQLCIDDDRLFYLSRYPLADDMLRSLVVAAIRRSVARSQRSGGFGDSTASDDLLDSCARLANQTDASNVGALLAEAAQGLLHADRAEYFIYDASASLLRSHAGPNARGRSESAAAGLLGYVARTGQTVQLEKAGVDPRLDIEADALTASGHTRFLAEPTFGADGTVAGVVAVTRNAAAPPFSAADVWALERLADCAGSALSMIHLKHRIETAMLTRQHAAGIDMFREEALRDQFETSDAPGSLLRLSPQWLTWAHWLAVCLFAAAALFMLFAPVSEYAAGPALIRARSKIPAIAGSAGIVRSVYVSAGDRVRTGDLLVRFTDPPGATPDDNIAEQVWAAGSGVVRDIRVRSGQHVNQGEVLATIVDDEAGLEVLAFIPGGYGPQVRPGMLTVLRLHGYDGSSTMLRLDSVGSEVLAADDAVRFATSGGAAALPIAGPVVAITAPLPSSTFPHKGRTYRYYDGMFGDIDVSVRTDRLITTVLRGARESLVR